MILIAELATSHGGDVGLAEAMIHAAAEAGATHVKTQAYSLERLNPNDPQADWLRQSHLDEAAHSRLMVRCPVEYLCTPFDAEALHMLRGLGLKQFKIASSESHSRWWEQYEGEQWVLSWPWGRKGAHIPIRTAAHITAIPLYPTPLECVGQATLLDGWSDHCEGLVACYWALSRGIKVLEVHFTHGASRRLSFDKTADDIKRLRDFAEDVETMSCGVSRKFRERWAGNVGK